MQEKIRDATFWLKKIYFFMEFGIDLKYCYFVNTEEFLTIKWPVYKE